LIGIDPNDDMVMIMQNGIGTQLNGKHGGQQFDAINDPLATMFKVKAGKGVFATQKSASDAAGNAVVVRCIV
jgi:hypothetical protein